VKVIIPLAGKGTRLRPLTHTVPKPLLEVAGKAVLDYVVDDLVDQIEDIEELIFITGHLKEQVEAHVQANCSVPSIFVEQEVQNGTAGAIKLAQPYVAGPVLIVFVDTLFDADLSVIRRDPEADGFIWAKEVEDYQRFGVIVTDGDGVMQTIVEKPSEPISRLANIGLYYLRDHKLLFKGVDHTLDSDPLLGEFFLTDSLQYMVDHGSRIQVLEVDGWYDCGKPETLLATNRHLLETGRARRPGSIAAASVEEPVRIEDDVEVAESTVGPNVSVGSGSRILRSTLRDCIVGRGVVIEDCRLSESLVGSHARLRDVEGTVFLGEHSAVGAGGGPAPAS
jgi:glucose-1-phosphate thymidylyltransferase